mmetsp:Transcript_9227/g.31771  ORF Transcript_9227/g.31771 Transcript_9227/m.31771 type:complete len:255 (-) Transcript_9227:1759-2523(-)
MDQVAFRAALHRTGAKTARLGESANCRGRDFVTRAHASLGCDGLPQPPARAKASAAGRGGSPEDSPEDSHKSRLGALKVEAMLRGGEKCDVLHSHDATDLSHVEDARAGKCEGWWLSVPFAAAATPAAEATVRSAPKFAASHFRVHSRASSRRCFAYPRSGVPRRPPSSPSFQVHPRRGGHPHGPPTTAGARLSCSGTRSPASRSSLNRAAARAAEAQGRGRRRAFLATGAPASSAPRASRLLPRSAATSPWRG